MLRNQPFLGNFTSLECWVGDELWLTLNRGWKIAHLLQCFSQRTNLRRFFFSPLFYLFYVFPLFDPSFPIIFLYFLMFSHLSPWREIPAAPSRAVASGEPRCVSRKERCNVTSSSASVVRHHNQYGWCINNIAIYSIHIYIYLAILWLINIWLYGILTILKLFGLWHIWYIYIVIACYSHI